MKSIRRSYWLWGLILVVLWAGNLWGSAGLQTTPPSTLQQRWLAAFQITSVISVTSFLPILLLYSFFKSERGRAQAAAVTEARANGWEEAFQDQIKDWYKTVFDESRYPVPATLALLTFIAGWSFVFFHDGPAVGELLFSRTGMNGLAVQIVEGPPLSYGFLGAYFFSIWFLFKRYISGDLGPGAFLHVSVRTWLVAILALVVAALVGDSAILATNEDTEAVVASVAFVGAFVPTALLNIIWDIARGAISWIPWVPKSEASLTELGGMNPWKAARFMEEGIDNVHNLALDQPSRLFVVTREGGLRILDWMDQAILYNAATNEVREALSKLGIRTAYDLFLALKTHDLVKRNRGAGGPGAYKVEEVPQAAFEPIDPIVLRYVAVNIFHHPSFENVRQMRDQALRTAAAQFPDTTMAMAPAEATAAAAPEALAMRPELHPSVLLVERAGIGPAASAVLVGERLALTTLDVSPQEIAFRAGTRSAEELDRRVAGTLVRADTATHLALYRLGESIGQPARRAARDPAPGEVLTKQSHVSGSQAGPVIGSIPAVEVISGSGSIHMAGMLRVGIAAASGEAGAPLFNEDQELAAILIAGNPDSTVAVPVSRIPSAAAAPKAPKPRRDRVRIGSGNGASVDQ